MIKSSTRRLLVSLAAVAVLASACSTGATTAPATAAPATAAPATAAPATPAPPTTYKIGFSNTGGTGNGFREEQNCTAKAEALASGQVEKVDMIARNADVNQQLADLPVGDQPGHVAADGALDGADRR